MDESKTPSAVAAELGKPQRPGCSQDNWGESTLIVFMTLDELRVYGPVALREQLKYAMPRRALPAVPAPVRALREARR